MAFAVALGVSPAMLLMPGHNDDDSEVQASDLVPISGWQKPVTARVVWEWLGGRSPLISGTLSNFVKFWPVWVTAQFEEMMAGAAAGMMSMLGRKEDAPDGDD